MSDIKPNPPVVEFLDDPHAPEVFATRAVGFFHFDGNVMVTFEAPRVDFGTEPKTVNRVVIGRLVLPIAGAQDLVNGLNAYLESEGLSPSAAAAGGMTRQ